MIGNRAIYGGRTGTSDLEPDCTKSSRNFAYIQDVL